MFLAKGFFHQKDLQAERKWLHTCLASENLGWKTTANPVKAAWLLPEKEETAFWFISLFSD